MADSKIDNVIQLINLFFEVVIDDNKDNGKLMKLTDANLSTINKNDLILFYFERYPNETNKLGNKKNLKGMIGTYDVRRDRLNITINYINQLYPYLYEKTLDHDTSVMNKVKIPFARCYKVVDVNLFKMVQDTIMSDTYNDLIRDPDVNYPAADYNPLIERAIERANAQQERGYKQYMSLIDRTETNGFRFYVNGKLLSDTEITQDIFLNHNNPTITVYRVNMDGTYSQHNAGYDEVVQIEPPNDAIASAEIDALINLREAVPSPPSSPSVSSKSSSSSGSSSSASSLRGPPPSSASVSSKSSSSSGSSSSASSSIGGPPSSSSPSASSKSSSSSGSASSLSSVSSSSSSSSVDSGPLPEYINDIINTRIAELNSSTNSRGNLVPLTDKQQCEVNILEKLQLQEDMVSLENYILSEAFLTDANVGNIVNYHMLNLNKIKKNSITTEFSDRRLLSLLVLYSRLSPLPANTKNIFGSSTVDITDLYKRLKSLVGPDNNFINANIFEEFVNFLSKYKGITLPFLTSLTNGQLMLKVYDPKSSVALSKDIITDRTKKWVAYTCEDIPLPDPSDINSKVIQGFPFTYIFTNDYLSDLLQNGEDGICRVIGWASTVIDSKGWAKSQLPRRVINFKKPVTYKVYNNTFTKKTTKTRRAAESRRAAAVAALPAPKAPPPPVPPVPPVPPLPPVPPVPAVNRYARGASMPR